MKVFILDDESSARETVKAYLKRIPDLNAEIKEADSIREAKKVLTSFEPDIALLDINLNEGTSFDLLSTLDPDQITFKIVFISAHDDYAIKAFKFSAIDYILKPINPMEFNAAIEKIVQDHTPTLPSQIDHLQTDLTERKSDKLILKDSQTIHFVSISTIIYCHSESNYTTFVFDDDSKITISKTLGEYEDLLKTNRFFRTHRSYLINMQQVKKYDKRDGGSIEMSNRDSIPLARNKKDIFMKLIDQL